MGNGRRVVALHVGWQPIVGAITVNTTTEGGAGRVLKCCFVVILLLLLLLCGDEELEMIRLLNIVHHHRITMA